MAQVLRNLLSNALKFTPLDGTVLVKCYTSEEDEFEDGLEETAGRRRKKEFVVEVIDSGAGISLENQKKLFNRVIQFHANVQQAGGGSGLGLWISMLMRP